MTRRPEDIPELIEFYYEEFKLLYSHAQTLPNFPVELLFEINAAFDHLTRYWKYGEDEKSAVDQAARHLKRGCFDAFKILLDDTMQKYRELRSVDTSIIDNGKFDRELVKLHNRILQGSIEARSKEGDSRDDSSWHDAFDRWMDVYDGCGTLIKDFYLNKDVEWARKKQGEIQARVDDAEKNNLKKVSFTYGIIAGVIGSTLFALIC